MMASGGSQNAITPFSSVNMSMGYNEMTDNVRVPTIFVLLQLISCKHSEFNF